MIEEIEEKQDENEAGDSDIDEIFDDDPEYFPDLDPAGGDAGQGGDEDEDDEEEVGEL